MFEKVNSEFHKKVEEKQERKFLMEAVMGDDFGTEAIPLSAEEEEAVVDVDSVPADALAKAYSGLDTYVDKEDFNDEELEEMIEELGDELDDEDLE